MPRRTANLLKSLLCLLLCLGGLTAFGAEDTNSVFRQRAEAEFHRTQQLFKADAGNASNAWVFARACFDLCDLGQPNARKAEIAKLGIAACRQLIARQPKSAPGHYYLAMNCGELADAEAPSVAAYRLVHEIEREFKLADGLDGKLDFAGPARCLGLLYRDAPGWPFSIGNKWKAQEALERADRLAPGFPENQLNLAESYLQWRDQAGAEAILKKIDATWSAAQTNLTGIAWEESWRDWPIRRAAAKKQFQKLFPEAPGM